MSEKLLPVVSHTCHTTHSACDCVLKRIAELEAECERLIQLDIARCREYEEILAVAEKALEIFARADSAVYGQTFVSIAREALSQIRASGKPSDSPALTGLDETPGGRVCKRSKRRGNDKTN